MATGYQNALNLELDKLGLSNLKDFEYQLSRTDLITLALQKDEGALSDAGAFVVNTAPYTGRSPNDKYLVENGDADLWFSSGAQKMDAAIFQRIKNRMLAFMAGQKLYIRDVVAGADPKYALHTRVISDLAWHSLAVANLFISTENLPHIDADFTILVSTHFAGDPALEGLRSPVFIILNFDEKLVLIGTTRYAGEIKKSVFTFMNYVLPKKKVLSLHCSANKGKDGDVALFFGLSGTGKTTLSSDPDRTLIGDDEHGWSDDGVFNFEGGCYAKTIRINPAYEPLVWSAINRFGCLIENVPLDANHHPDFDSACLTENTRAAYPLNFIGNYEPTGRGNHPNHIFFLTADAFGVLPPLAKLTNDQALYYFLSGYTSKLAGTERGLGDKPEATFSTCFGAPFLPLKPSIYAELLAEKLEEHSTHVWLLNTGWSGGGFGVGKRIPLPITRAMISAVLSGQLNNASTHLHTIFNLAIPDHIDGIPENFLNPEISWEDLRLYNTEAHSLAGKFVENFKRYCNTVSETVTRSGPMG